MFYYNTRYTFALPEGSPQTGVGAVLAASAMAMPELQRRKREHPYLQRCLFDPQLYLSGLEPATCRKTVVNLATYPWFGVGHAEVFDSKRHRPRNWKQANADALAAGWRRVPLTDLEGIQAGVRGALEFQLALGCEAVILPSPLTNSLDGYGTEMRWLDAGLEAADELRVAVPVFATIAVSDVVLRNRVPTQNLIIETVADQVAARRRLAGAYIVIEQPAETCYCLTSVDTMLSQLLIVDDLVRGAGKRVLIGYAGTFGAIATAAGAEIWMSGYYQSQRQLRLSSFEEKIAAAMPRYYSPGLLGDLGLDHDLEIARQAQLLDPVMAATPAAEPLHRALAQGHSPASVPTWRFAKNNLDAAKAHYNWCQADIGAQLHDRSLPERVNQVHERLERAVEIASLLQRAGVGASHYSDLKHQGAWLEAFEAWKRHSGV
jgi:hypothetical protein